MSSSSARGGRKSQSRKHFCQIHCDRFTLHLGLLLVHTCACLARTIARLHNDFGTTMPTQSSRRSPSHQVRGTPSGGGFTPVAFFLWTCVPARGRHVLQKETITAQDLSAGTLCYGAGRQSSAQRNLRRGFSLDPRTFPGALPGTDGRRPQVAARRLTAPSSVYRAVDEAFLGPRFSVIFQRAR